MNSLAQWNLNFPVDFGNPQSIAPYHTIAADSFPPPDQVAIATQNKPFGGLVDFVREIIQTSTPCTNIQGVQRQMIRQYMAKIWLERSQKAFGSPVLQFLPSTSLSGNYDREEEEVETYVATSQRLGATEQATTFRRLYEEFVTVRRVFVFLEEHDLLTWDSIIPDALFPWYLVVAPVWFVNVESRQEDRVRADPFTARLVSRLGTERLALWHQFWNPQARPIAEYVGDLIPENIMHLMEDAKKVFDSVIIATPYHEVTLRERREYRVRSRLVDPFVIGIQWNIPHFAFNLARFSNSGVFPCSSQMVAQTMRVIEENMTVIGNIWPNRGWFMPTSASREGREIGGRDLAPLFQEGLETYNNAALYSWLTYQRPTIDQKA